MQAITAQDGRRLAHQMLAFAENATCPVRPPAALCARVLALLLLYCIAVPLSCAKQMQQCSVESGQPHAPSTCGCRHFVAHCLRESLLPSG